MRRNAPPPFLVAATGKPTMLPMPTAEPAAAKINPKRDQTVREVHPLNIPIYCFYSWGKMLTATPIKVFVVQGRNRKFLAV